MKRLLLILLLLVVSPGLASAQSDKDILTRWLEENLSGAGRTITIDGFTGALSSQSRLERLTIADDIGVWLVLEDAVLNWKRAALLKGRLEIEELSAARVMLNRRPEPVSAPITAESKESFQFSLPDLPVSIEIGKLSVARVELEAAIIGEAVTLSLSGDINLNDGEGQARLNIDRLDATQGSLQLKGSFSNTTRDLQLALNVTEDRGGILSNLLNLPDSPRLTIDLNGDGTLPEFAATFDLKTDGQPRLTGKVLLHENTNADNSAKTLFRADLAGDITPLLVSDYKRFFGSRAALHLEGFTSTDGRVTLETFSIATKALELTGSIGLMPDGQPDYFDLVGKVGYTDGQPTILPLAGEKIRLNSATLNAHFQSSKSDLWSLNAQFIGLDHPMADIGSGRITSSGLLFRNLGGDPAQPIHRVTADIAAAFVDIQPTDQTLASAIGSTATATAALDWRSHQSLLINSFSLVSDQFQTSGSGSVAGNSDGFKISGDAIIETGPLDRFSGLPDQPLQGGSGALNISGWWQPIGGAFDLKANGKTKALKFLDKPFYGLFEGDGSFNTAIRRDPNGLLIDQLEMQTPSLFASTKGNISTEDSDLLVEVKISDISSLIDGISGPAAVEGAIKQSGEPWDIDITAIGPGGAKASIAGSIDENLSKAGLGIKGALPVGLANGFLPSEIALQGLIDFDLRLAGPINASSLSGKIRTGNSTAAMPVIGTSFDQIAGVATIENGIAQLDFSASVSNGGQISVQGQQGIVAPFVSNVDVNLVRVVVTDPPTFRTTLNGTLHLGANSAVSGTIDLSETEMRLVPANGGSIIPDIQHIGETQPTRNTRQRAGLLNSGAGGASTNNSTGIPLDILVNAPSKIFIRGRGLDAEMGGSLLISGTSNAVVPSGQFNLLRGRLDLLGKRFDLQEGQLSMQGSLQPTYSLTAVTQTPDATVRVIIAGTPDSPEISFRSDPDLPEDEVLAQLIFGKGIAKISPLQAVQLAGAISTLTGDGEEGVVGRIRSRFSLDDLDIVTTDDGSVAVRAGKYISENTYADVTANSDGKTEINLNLDLNTNLTVRGSAATDGNTSLGLFFEKDY